MIGPAMIGHVRKRDEHRDGAILTLTDWSRQLVGKAASARMLKRTIVLHRVPLDRLQRVALSSASQESGRTRFLSVIRRSTRQANDVFVYEARRFQCQRLLAKPEPI